jgi:hypothetical protein
MTDNVFFKERVEKLSAVLVPHIYHGLSQLYKTAKELRPDHPLKMFQLCMKRIRDLPRSRLNEDYRVLLNSVNKRGIPRPHEWLQKILNDIFVSYVRTNIILPDHGRVSHLSLNDIPVPMPKAEEFVHHVYIEACRRFWMNPALFSDRYDRLTQQENIMKSKSWISDSIYQTIREYVPLEEIEERLLRGLHQPQARVKMDDFHQGEIPITTTARTQKDSKVSPIPQDINRSNIRALLSTIDSLQPIDPNVDYDFQDQNNMHLPEANQPFDRRIAPDKNMHLPEANQPFDLPDKDREPSKVLKVDSTFSPGIKSGGSTAHQNPNGDGMVNSDELDDVIDDLMDKTHAVAPQTGRKDYTQHLDHKDTKKSDAITKEIEVATEKSGTDNEYKDTETDSDPEDVVLTPSEQKALNEGNFEVILGSEPVMVPQGGSGLETKSIASNIKLQEDAHHSLQEINKKEATPDLEELEVERRDDEQLELERRDDEDYFEELNNVEERDEEKGFENIAKEDELGEGTLDEENVSLKTFRKHVQEGGEKLSKENLDLLTNILAQLPNTLPARIIKKTQKTELRDFENSKSELSMITAKTPEDSHIQENTDLEPIEIPIYSANLLEKSPVKTNLAAQEVAPVQTNTIKFPKRPKEILPRRNMID